MQKVPLVGPPFWEDNALPLEPHTSKAYEEIWLVKVLGERCSPRRMLRKTINGEKRENCNFRKACYYCEWLWKTFIDDKRQPIGRIVSNNFVKGDTVIKSLFFQETCSVSAPSYYTLLLAPKEPFLWEPLTCQWHIYLIMVVPVCALKEKLVFANDLMSRTRTTIAMFYQGFLCAGHCSKCFTCIVLFTTQTPLHGAFITHILQKRILRHE